MSLLFSTDIARKVTGSACEVCGKNMPPDFEIYGIEEPCSNCGLYKHATAYCKRDTIHSCGRTHDCKALPPCNCATRVPDNEHRYEIITVDIRTTRANAQNGHDLSPAWHEINAHETLEIALGYARGVHLLTVIHDSVKNVYYNIEGQILDRGKCIYLGLIT